MKYSLVLISILMISIFPQFSHAQSCVSPPPDMISWWPGDGNTDDIVDSNPGVLENGASFAAGKVGSAFSFDGVDDQVRVPHSANQNAGAELTVDAWINPDVISHGQSIINKRPVTNIGDGGFTFETSQTISPNGLQFGIGTNTGTFLLISGSDVLTAGVFQHVAATYDGAMMRIYVDGVEVASSPASGTIKPTTTDLVIGRNIVIPSFAFDGIIDEVEFFGHALSLDEIKSIVDAGSSGKCKQESPPVGGTIIPIDMTSLFIAGIQSGTIWMVPTLVGLAGAGLYLIKFRKN